MPIVLLGARRERSSSAEGLCLGKGIETPLNVQRPVKVDRMLFDVSNT